MEIYLVGGAVRDELLNYPVKERDWVVVGATPEEMLAQGFTQVGKDFPVFLHPQTGEEYALARTERKTAAGYYGFAVHADPDVTLEDDLRRRDLTINAMARDAEGNLVDPYGGLADLEARILRHVSPAFAEDPVRILRLARFAARYAHLGFTVAEETLQLMRSMVDAGEVDALVAERVWQEWARALAERTPSRFVEVLRECGALSRLAPELECLFGVPQPEKYHPEIDTGRHSLLALDQAARLSTSGPVRFAALLHDLGKGLTPQSEWPSHRGHEERGVDALQTLCERFKVPNDYRDLAVLACRWHRHVHKALELKPGSILKLLEGCDALRRPQRFHDLLLACEADARGRTGLEDRDYPQADYLRQCLEAARAVDARRFVEQGLKGPAIAEAMRQARNRAIAAVTSSARG